MTTSDIEELWRCILLAVAGVFGAVSGLIVARSNVPSFIAKQAAGTIIGGTTF